MRCTPFRARVFTCMFCICEHGSSPKSHDDIRYHIPGCTLGKCCDDLWLGLTDGESLSLVFFFIIMVVTCLRDFFSRKLCKKKTDRLH